MHADGLEPGRSRVPPAVRGRTRITPAALTSLAEAAAASQLVVPVGTVSVRIADEGGALGVRVSGPISSLPLSMDAPAETLVRRTERLRQNIGHEIAALSGNRVGSVALHVTAVRLQPRRRVA